MSADALLVPTCSFTAWLLRQVDRTDDVGAVARLAAGDPDFPQISNPHGIRTHLLRKHLASIGVKGAWRMALEIEGQWERGGIELEQEIVWLEDPSGLPYVRAVVSDWERTRRLRPGGRYHRLIGYSVLWADAPRWEDRFLRRVFHLTEWDPYAGGGCPVEAVDPLTVLPGKEAVQTDRCGAKRDPGIGKMPKPLLPTRPVNKLATRLLSDLFGD